MDDRDDRRFVAAAIRLGASALGSTWPNPAVGAIVVKDGCVVGRARTARGGRPHGEALALAMAGEQARDATLYASLEPCSHFGRTPPCSDAIIAAGVRRVVTTLSDPDPRVSGAGLERLRQSGIEVTTGHLKREAERAQIGHFTRMRRGRPHVALKLAVSVDDAIGRAGEPQVPVTGDIARRHAQALRTRFDAVMVGRGTVEADDPRLTCRLPGLNHRSPVRVVLDSAARLGEGYRVFSEDTPTWIFSAAPSETSSEQTRSFAAPRGAGGLDLWACFSQLAEEGITRVLVEGGARLARSLLEADLADEVLLFRSPAMLGGDIVPALAGLPLSSVERSPHFEVIERRRFRQDSLRRYKRVR